jgi:hypothetical protein
LTERLIIKGKEYSSPPYSKETFDFLLDFAKIVKENDRLTGRIEIPLQFEDGANELLVLDNLTAEEVSHIIEIAPVGLSLHNQVH